MVQASRGYYEEDEPSFHRYGSRGTAYALSHEKELPLAPLHLAFDSGRRHHASVHDTRHRENSSEQDSSTRPRSRIPVACLRCRKRKIRCSGDNGGACSNCKNAGNEQCQFLRVSSQDVPMKSDASVAEFFDPGAAISRLQCRVIPQGSQLIQTPSPVEYDPYQYRSSSMSAYQQYSGKPYCHGVPAYAEFEGPVDYGFQNSPYQLMTSEQQQASSPNSNFASTGQVRSWESAPQLPKSNPHFIDQEQPIYSHHQLPYSYVSLGIPLRTIHPDSKGPNTAGLATLSTQITGNVNDRPVLPFPSTNRPVTHGSFLRNDSLLSMAQPSCHQSYNNNYMTANMLHSLKAQNNSAVSENSSYNMPLTSANPESVAYGESNNSLSLNQHQNELYSSSENLNYHTDPPSEPSYDSNNSGASSKRDSKSCATTTRDGPSPSVTEEEPPNGHHYIPYHNGLSRYPTPPMGMTILPPAQRKISIQPVQ